MTYVLMALLFALPSTLSAGTVINLNTLKSVEQADGVVVSDATVEKVAVEQKQKGMLLALVPITFTVRATADARGNVEVKYPWYSILTIDKQDEVRTKAKIAVDNALKASAVGTVRAEGEPSSPRFTSTQAKLVEAELRKVLENVFAEFASVD